MRRRNYRYYDHLISEAKTEDELQVIELEVNEMVRERKLRTFQGLVLRNAIEIREDDLTREHLDEEE